MKIRRFNESVSEAIEYEGQQYYISNEKLKKDDLYINYSNYKRGVINS